MDLNVFQCTDCQLTLFPERYICPHCGGTHWRLVDAGVGIIEQLTRVVAGTEKAGGEPVVLATVHFEAGAFVIAQLGEAMAQGERVRLQEVGGGKVIALRA
ncbi:hypothetical protein R69746_07569 [Paraburkholderia aspalathi]|uniref:zinc ribbon domain-containing protein n=1 Tax=Paraburkholderia aspalathi TaxID=1324617 RepID=UPI00190BA42B|nr:zinc ribbon domain-containing protein [Paraburkholderia aspalathi]MBK3843553.1 rubredoxin [Paraburkholderia aspalathi]CAE6855759.1 hypothetical protein R69746_07569 [Paraburkholderia aspalathi]